MLAVVLVYGGLIVVSADGVSLLKPLASIGISTRLQGVYACGLGLFIAGVGWTLPAKEVRIAAPRTQLGQFALRYQFNEVHSIRVMAPKHRVYHAIQSVTAGEILFFQTLIWIRRFGRPGPERILNAPEQQPLLEVATRTSFCRWPKDQTARLSWAPRSWRRMGGGRGNVPQEPTLRRFVAGLVSIERLGRANWAQAHKSLPDRATRI